MKNKRTLVLATVIANAIICVSFSATGIACGYAISDDASKYSQFMDENPILGDGSLYNEWWYYETKDPDAGIEFFTTIGITNPENLAAGLLGGSPGCGFVFSGISVNGILDDTININETNIYAIEECTASETTLSVNIASIAFMEGIDEDMIHVWGEDEYMSTSFDLIYFRNLAPAPEHTVRVGPLPGDLMQHQAFMASAHVLGTITYNNITYEIDGLGYHDHQWGSPLLFNWQPWVSVYSDSFALVMIDSNYAVGSNAYLAAFIDGGWVDFGNPCTTVVENTVEPLFGYEYPIKLTTSANNGAYRVSVTISRDGSGWVADAGGEGILMPVVKSMNYAVTGTIKKWSWFGFKWNTIKTISSPCSSFEWVVTDLGLLL